jgi:hypothetical protein
LAGDTATGSWGGRRRGRCSGGVRGRTGEWCPHSGYYASRAQVGYQLRATATNELRRLTIEARAAFHNWIARPAYTGGPGDFDGGTNVGAKIDVLNIYFKAHREWLDGKSRESMERILVGLGGHFHAHMTACGFPNERKEQRETARDAEEWLSGELPRLMENVRAIPWWRRRPRLGQ